MQPAMPAVPQPPRRWTLGTFALIVVVSATALLALLLLLVNVTTLLLALSGGPAIGFTLLRVALAGAPALYWTYLTVWVAFATGLRWWWRATKAMVEPFGVDEDGAKRMARVWPIRIGVGALVVDTVLRVLDVIGPPDHVPSHPTMSRVAIWSGRLAADDALTLLGLLFLLLGIVFIREQALRAMAGSAAAPGDVPVEPPTLGLQGAAGPPTPAAPAADDAFWERVRTLSAERGGDLALLETTTTRGRRWLIVPAVDPLSVHERVAPGSVVTVFPEPLRPGGQAPKKRPVAEPGTEWYGLLESTGTTRFQLLLPTRVTDWLGQARGADRYGLYRADDPATLTATMPASAARTEPEPA